MNLLAGLPEDPAMGMIPGWAPGVGPHDVLGAVSTTVGHVLNGAWQVHNAVSGAMTVTMLLDIAAAYALDSEEARLTVENRDFVAAHRQGMIQRLRLAFMHPRQRNFVVEDVVEAFRYGSLAVSVKAYAGAVPPPPVGRSVRDPVWWYGGSTYVTGAQATKRYQAKYWEKGIVAWSIKKGAEKAVVFRTGDLVYSRERTKQVDGWWDDGTLDVRRATALFGEDVAFPLVGHQSYNGYTWAIVGIPQRMEVSCRLLTTFWVGDRFRWSRRLGRRLDEVVVMEDESLTQVLRRVQGPTAEETQKLRWNAVMASAEVAAQAAVAAARNAGMTPNAAQFTPEQMVAFRDEMEMAYRLAQRRSQMAWQNP